MNAALINFASQAAARIGWAIFAVLMLFIVPTFVHSLFTEGVMSASQDVGELTRWIISGIALPRHA